MEKRKAVVIGAGIAGLAAAIRLAVQGFSVNVFEKNNYPGGKLSAFEEQGFYFDAGPSLFTQPENIEALFSIAGEPIEGYFSFAKLEIACKYFFESGKIVRGFTDAIKFANEMQETLGEPAKNTLQYLQRSQHLYDNIGAVFLNHSLHKKKTWLNKRIFKALRAVKLSYLFKTLNGYNKRFETPEAAQIFNRFATYSGSNPYRAPAMLSLIPSLEHNNGAYYPAGGMISITNALYRLAQKKGVRFQFDMPVQKIICPENKAIGIVVDKENIYADVIISNSDVYFTYKNLIGHNPKGKKLLRERSSSALVFYWGISKSFPELQLHNIFFSSKYKEEFDHIFRQKKLFNDPTVYVNITSKEEASKAPPGMENWFVMINVPSSVQYDDEAFIAQAKKNIVEKLNRILKTDIEKYIVTEQKLHPKLIEERTDSFTGALYGTASNTRYAAFLRHANFTGYLENLYFCGGSVHPGGGIPLCLKSAKIVSDLVEKDYAKKPVHV